MIRFLVSTTSSCVTLDKLFKFSEPLLLDKHYGLTELLAVAVSIMILKKKPLKL